MRVSGTVFRYGDNVDTDVIIPARYLNTSNHAELALHCMEDLDATFKDKVRKGDIIVADANFGCGSSRSTLRSQSGGGSVRHRPFLRPIFYRNSINIGLPILECQACADIKAGTPSL